MNDLDRELVSIVLPVYNGEKYISLSIESCLKQTHKNIELIIVNDCSTDGTLSIINKYAQRDDRIKIINNVENRKLPTSLNIGHNEATGKFITWTSDDNFYELNAVEKLLKALAENKADIAYSDIYLINEFGDRVKEVRLLAFENIVFGNVIGSCFLYKKEVFEKNKGYNEEFFLIEDYDFWLRAVLHSKYFKLNQFLYNYRMHENSLTNQISTVSDKQILWQKNIGKMYIKFSESFLDDNFEAFSQLQIKILNCQKLKFDWIIQNYSTIKTFQKNISKNKNFPNKKTTGKVFLNQMILIMTRNFDSKKCWFYCFFIFKRYFYYLDKNSTKTLIKYSFFK